MEDKTMRIIVNLIEFNEKDFKFVMMKIAEIIQDEKNKCEKIYRIGENVIHFSETSTGSKKFTVWREVNADESV